MAPLGDPAYTTMSTLQRPRPTAGVASTGRSALLLARGRGKCGHVARGAIRGCPAGRTPNADAARIVLVHEYERGVWGQSLRELQPYAAASLVPVAASAVQQPHPQSGPGARFPVFRRWVKHGDSHRRLVRSRPGPPRRVNRRTQHVPATRGRHSDQRPVPGGTVPAAMVALSITSAGSQPPGGQVGDCVPVPDACPLGTGRAVGRGQARPSGPARRPGGSARSRYLLIPRSTR